MSLPYAKVVVNPVAGGCSVHKEWPRISKQLRDVGLSFDYEFTRGTGHAIEIARQATDIGYRCLVVVGGDGTVNEVANGIMHSTNSANTVLGIVNVGSTNAFAFSSCIAENFVNHYSFLTGKGRVLIDVGVVQCWSQGQLTKRFFVNEASVGFPSEVVKAWKYLPNRFGRSINLALRIASTYKSLATHRNKKIRFNVANKVESIRCCGIVVANGQYFANRMHIAPHASLDDGLLDVVVFGDLTKSELLKIRPTLYSGDHVKNPKIRESKTTSITIESNEKLLVEADGEILGETPASFRVIPSALTIVV
jgi:YegS/Rv2252/BmrU family lipid kinase